MMKLIFLLIFSFFSLVNYVLGQNTDINSFYPEVGKPMPEFVLNNIEFFENRNNASNVDFKDKWLILDFWNKGCSSCVASFPEINREQKKFNNDVRFMLIGIEDKENQIRNIYYKFREKQHLNLPCSFDSALAKKFDIYASPYIIIVDPNGIVRGVTNKLDSTDVQMLLDGKQPYLPKAYRRHETIPDLYPSADNKIAEQNADTSFIYHSLFSKWDEKIPFRTLIFKSNKFQIFGYGLADLFKFAYCTDQKSSWYSDSLYGKLFPWPILELKDSSLFQVDYVAKKNLYCYNLICPTLNADKIRIKKILQNELQNCFGYTATVENRKMPYWRLLATKKAKNVLRTKTDIPYYESPIPHMGFIARNYPISALIGFLWSCKKGNLPIIDETGICGNIDIKIDAMETDFEDVRRELERKGLELVRGERYMKVLVIKDYLESALKATE